MLKRIFTAAMAALMLMSALSTAVTAEEEVYIPVYKTDEKEEALDIPETIEVEVTAKESNVIRTTEERQLLGVALEWGTSNTGFMKDSNSTEFSSQYLEAAEQIKSIYSTRTAGASLNNFAWKTSIGPMAKRKVPGSAWYYPTPVNYGPTEWVKQFQMINPDCEFIVGLNIAGDTPKNLADYAEFFLGDETTEYGALRASYGIKEPVKVGAFELGNELDYMFAENPEDYGKKALPVILAIRERFPEAKFIMCGKTYPLEQGVKDMTWRNWTIKNMEILGEYVDYISFHSYYDGQTVAWTELYLDQIQEDIKSVIGEDRKIKFAFTEAAVWPRDNGYGDPPLESQTQMLTGVLSTADFLSRMFKRDDTWSSSYFCWGVNLTGNWGMIGPGVNEQKWYINGILQLYNLYDEMLGEKIIYSYAKSDNKYALYEHSSSKYSVLVTQNGDDELMLIITNKTAAKKFHTTFNFEHKYKLVEETVFTAPDMESKVYGKDTKDVFTTTATPMDIENFNEYTAPEKSVVFLRLERTDKSNALAEEVSFSGENAFADIDDFWGKNEINNLAQSGFVNGTGEAKFSPYDTLTRAQLAQMLSNVFAPNSEKKQSPFKDVDSESWYSPAIYNVYTAGYMRGEEDGLFYPDRVITLEELVTITARVARSINADTEKTDTALLNRFVMADEISDWAKESVAYATKSGLISKFYENGYFMPKQNATRGQAAVLLYRLYAMK